MIPSPSGAMSLPRPPSLHAEQRKQAAQRFWTPGYHSSRRVSYQNTILAPAYTASEKGSPCAVTPKCKRPVHGFQQVLYASGFQLSSGVIHIIHRTHIYRISHSIKFTYNPKSTLKLIVLRPYVGRHRAMFPIKVG